jgi:deazaflavin-dependent oxidoreductase (nitroreductase family)
LNPALDDGVDSGPDARLASLREPNQTPLIYRTESSVALEGDYAPLKHKPWIRDQIEAWERSGGIEGTTLPDTGEPCVIIVTRGARSGQLQRTPLIRVELEGRYAAVGSGAGGPKNPGWVANIRAGSHVEVWDGQNRGDYMARELGGVERQDWWDRSVVAFAPYLEYQAMTERVIPVFVLEPARD